MATSVQSVLLNLMLNVTENPGGGGVVSPSVFNALNQFLQLGPLTVPIVTLMSVYDQAVSGGYTIDLTNANGTNGVTGLNATGKKIVAILANNPIASANNATIKTGASNGYSIPPSSGLVTPPGGFCLYYFGNALTAIDSTHKTLDISDSTTTDVPEFAILLG